MDSTKSKPAIPSEWPGAFKIYKTSKQAVLINIWTIVILWLVNVAVSIVLTAAFKNVGRLIGDVASVFFGTATYIAYLEGVKGNEVSLSEALNKAIPLWLRVFGLTIIVGLSLVVSFVLLVIPFLFVLPRLALSPYFLIDKNMDVMEAYKASWNQTKAHTGKVWGVIGATLAMALLAITIIGIPFAIYFLVMYSAAFAVLYTFIAKHPSHQTKPAAASK